MIEDGLSYPLEGDEAVKNLLIGGVITFIGQLLFFPLLLVGGYLIGVLRTSVQGYNQPPAWQDWGDLLVDGLKAWLIGAVYSFVPMVIFFILAFVIMGLGGAADSGGFIGGGMIILFLLAIPVYFIIMYVVPAALTNFAVNDSIGAAFDFGTIVDVITDGEYMIAAIIAIVISVVAGTIIGLLYFVLIGFLVAPFVYFYVYVAVMRMFANAYAKATTQTAPGGQPGTQQPVAD